MRGVEPLGRRRRVLVGIRQLLGAPRADIVGGLALAAILAYALYLRLHGITWGLPYNYLNPDEATIVREAFHIAQGRINPSWFFYPSLMFYLVAAVYRGIGLFWHPVFAAAFVSKESFVVDATPYYLSARLVVVACGVVSVYLVYWVGREAFSRPIGLLAALFLAVAPLHVTYSHYAVTDVPATTIALLSLVLLVRAAKGGSRRALAWGAFVAGAATSTKYNLGMLVIPATLAGIYVLRQGSAGAAGEPDASAPALGARGATLGLARRVYLPMALGFVAFTPFSVLDAPHFLRDFLAQNRIVARGWLGFEHTGNGYWYNLHVNLPAAMGVVLFALSLAGLAWAVYRHRRADVMFVSLVLVYYLYVSSWAALQERYLLPIVPILVLLASRLAVDLVRVGFSRRPLLVPVVAAVLVAGLFLPLSASVAYDQSLHGVDVRSIAKSWVEEHIPRGTTIATEPYGPPLVSRRAVHYFRASGRHQIYYRVVALPLPLPGVTDKRHTIAFLRRKDVRYVIISSEVYGRVLAASKDYPYQVNFYRALARQAKLIKVFTPGVGERGPTIELYRVPLRLLSEGHVANQPGGDG
jgi:4-amino-4-deoxy-L-arabinose transferase-like glycosyltransferase